VFDIPGGTVTTKDTALDALNIIDYRRRLHDAKLRTTTGRQKLTPALKALQTELVACYAGLKDRAGTEAKLLSDLIVEAFEGLVKGVALKIYYLMTGAIPLDDLEQEGSLGLMKALARFDPALCEAGDFEKWATPNISGEIRRAVRDRYGRQIRIPRHLHDLLSQIGRLRREWPDPEHPPTVEQIAEALTSDKRKVTPALVVAALRARTADMGSILSLDELRGNDGTLLLELPISERGFEHVELYGLMAGLPEREQRILLMRFWGDMTQSQIADEMGISQMHVSRLITGATSRMREAAEVA
jgi:RNA polymerase sigma-B factor